MKMINIRGCNGSGKTTLLRALAKDPACRVAELKVRHTIKDKVTKEPKEVQHPPIPVTYTPEGYAILGDYTPAMADATTAGCDRIKTQEAAKKCLDILVRDPAVRVILFEGIVVSTIYGPWKDFAKHYGGMVWAFLDTPLEDCLRRVQERNGGKPVKEDQIADKHKTIARVRDKALADGLVVADIAWKTPVADLTREINNLIFSVPL